MQWQKTDPGPRHTYFVENVGKRGTMNETALTRSAIAAEKEDIGQHLVQPSGRASPSPSAKRHQGEQSPRRTNSQQYGDNRRDRSGSPHRNQQPQLDYTQLARALAVEMEKRAMNRQRSVSPNQRHEKAQQEKPWQLDSQQERNRTQDAGSTPGRQVHFAQSVAEPAKDEQKSEEAPHIYLPNN